MSLPNWVEGSLRPSLALTWLENGTTTPVDLTGATLTGFIKRQFGDFATRAIAGDLTVTAGDAGQFRWDLHQGDVAEAGTFLVQFNAAFGSGQTPAKTFQAKWEIRASLEIE